MPARRSRINGLLIIHPVSRKTIIMTQISVLVITLAALICLMTLAQIIVSHLMFPGDLDVSRLIYMNIDYIVFI